MSYKAPADGYAESSSAKHGNDVNAGIDSSFASNPSHRGSLTPSELDSIHQTNSFKQATQLEEKDNRELEAKMKKLQQTEVPKT
jgi:hypothetical protein